MGITKQAQLLASGIVVASISAIESDAMDILADGDLEAKETISVFDKPIVAGCNAPANRDYHAILGLAEHGTEDHFKFSGCGSAI